MATRKKGAAGASLVEGSSEVTAESIPFSTDGVAVRTVFADAIRGTSIMQGVARLNLIEYKVDALDKDSLKAKHVVTIAMPANQLRSWAAILTKVADETGN